MSATGLSTIARYAIRSGSSGTSHKLFSLVISGGSVVDFIYAPPAVGRTLTEEEEAEEFATNPLLAGIKPLTVPEEANAWVARAVEIDNKAKSAIVNAANEECLGGGGVDGAISDAGGPTLLKDRTALREKSNGVRCPTGEAVITGPGKYGDLGVSHVIHAVGPNYMIYDQYDSDSESCGEGEIAATPARANGYATGDALLRSAYVNSMRRATERGLAAVAFSLISSGIFRGRHSKKEVLKIGIEGITSEFVAEITARQGGGGVSEGLIALQEVHLCAFNAEEARLLTEICEELGLEKE